jgi:two-component system response regulator DesR
MPIGVLIVDDMSQVRQDLRTLLDLSEDIEIVGEAANGLEAVGQVASLQPDVVLLDLEMPVLDGYQAASQIKALYPSCRVIALTVHGHDAALQKALHAGVDSFLVKGTPIEMLLQAILDRED